MEQDLRVKVQKQDAALDAATRIPIITKIPEQAEDWEEEEDQPEEAADREEVRNEDYRNSRNQILFKMKKRIAIPLENGILCSHFGHCEQFAIIDADDNLITDETLVTPPPHEPGLLPGWLAEKGVTDVIAGGMGQRAIDLFNHQNINVFVGAPQKKPKELTSDLLNNTLQAGANYCDH